MKTWNVSTAAQLATAETSAQPGDTILLSGVFKGVPIVPRVSGSQIAPIRYQAAATGATFDAAGLTTPLVNITGRQWVVFDAGIKFTNSAYKTAPCANRGIILRNSSHIAIRSCAMSYVQMQLIGSSDNVIQTNVWREFVAVYVNGQPQTSGDMLNIVGGSHRNDIVDNDMKFAGHSLIEIGNGFGGMNSQNLISGNTLSNPWYKSLILADDGDATSVRDNQILDANSVPTLYSTVPGMVGKLQTSSEAIQFSGRNFIVRDNTIANAVAMYGVISLGARYYAQAGKNYLIESRSNQVYGNTIQNCKGAAVFSFEQNYVPGTDPTIPTMTGNLIHDNTISGMTPSGAYSWDKTSHFETVIFRSFKGATPWVGLNGNKVYANAGFSSTNAYRSSYVNAAGSTTTKVMTPAQFQASDPTNVYGNS